MSVAKPRRHGLSGMSKTSSEPAFPLAAADAAAELVRWLGYLSHEKRMSPRTVEAYQRDVRQFLDFLSGHLGRKATLAALARLAPLDVRAFMAARRSDGIGSRSLMRMLAGVRSFARFLERRGGAQHSCAPILQHGLHVERDDEVVLDQQHGHAVEHSGRRAFAAGQSARPALRQPCRRKREHPCGALWADAAHTTVTRVERIEAWASRRERAFPAALDPHAMACAPVVRRIAWRPCR